MGDYFKYYPINLRGFEKFFFRSIVFSLRVILVSAGFAFVFSSVPVFKVLGFWLVIIFVCCFLKSKFWSKSDIRLSRNKNIADYCNQETLDIAFDTFKDIENVNINPVNAILFFKLAHANGVKTALKNLNINVKEFQREAGSFIEVKNALSEVDIRKNTEYVIRENLLPVLIKAREIAKSLCFPCISSEILFSALCEMSNFEASTTLNRFSLTPEAVRAAIVSIIFTEKPFSFLAIQSLSKFMKPFYGIRPTFRKLSILSTPFLEKYGINLTYSAQKYRLGFVIGHRKEIGEINSIFSKNTRPSIILNGEQGSGKNSIINHLSWLIANGLTFGKSTPNRVIQIDLSNLRLEDPQEFNTILSRIFNESLNAGNVILYLSQIQNIAFDRVDSLFSLLKQFLPNGLPVIILTNSLFNQKLNQFPEIQKHFRVIEVEEISIIEAISILALESKLLGKKYNIFMTPQAIAIIAELSKKYLPEKLLPDSAKETTKRIFEFVQKEKIKTITEEIAGDFISKTSL